MDEDSEIWVDEFLDEELKSMLKTRASGKFIQVDLLAHIDYFFNTMECHTKTEHPLSKPAEYKAL